MQISCHAQQTFQCAPQAVFELMVDPLRFPATFVGCGPIPAIRAITRETPLAVGAVRRIHNSDGTTLTEHVTALDPPIRHAYVLSGFRAPFAWLVRKGEADWSVNTTTAECSVRWTYSFTLTTVLIYPLAVLLLGFFMRRAMQRCLENMASLLASAASNPAVVK